jgi:predicted DNA-binding helix-hairpin-helix protein
MDTLEKLSVLSQDSQYDLACACATPQDQHRRRSEDHKWIYPVVLPSGGTTFLFKTLLSNECVNDCAYCPLRSGSEARRCSLSPEELVKSFVSYYNARKVSGLFLSSAVAGTPDATMERINRAAQYLRRGKFRGYIHLKIIPGASEAAIRQSVSLASAVSLNIEAPAENHFRRLTATKDYQRDIINSIELISRLTEKGSVFERVKHTTQFVVGAAEETDQELMISSWNLYQNLKLDRIYFSAYQRAEGATGSAELLTREHRLYQADWLIRKYGFQAQEIPLEPGGNLSLTVDPKEMWARRHPEFFPVDINRDDKWRLLRVPGLGQVMVGRILALRANGVRVRSLYQLGSRSKILRKAGFYVIF